MQTTIALEEMSFFAYHGYYDIEQKIGHHYTLDIEVYIDCADDVDLGDTVNYEDLYSICADVMNNPQRLLETIISSIQTRCMERFPHIQGGKITLRKHQPQLGGQVKHASVSKQWKI